MEVNEWVNGYLEAILDVGSSSRKGKDDGKHRVIRFEEEERNLEENSNNGNYKFFSPTKYFVEQVIDSFDESDLYRTWVKVCVSSSLFLSLLYLYLVEVNELVIFSLLYYDSSLVVYI